jgi:predicted RNase H-like HicB family nuclease
MRLSTGAPALRSAIPRCTSIAQRSDERWLGELPELPGVVAYGATKAEARTNTIALAFRVIGERIAHGEPVPINVEDYFVGA